MGVGRETHTHRYTHTHTELANQDRRRSATHSGDGLVVTCLNEWYQGGVILSFFLSFFLSFPLSPASPRKQASVWKYT